MHTDSTEAMRPTIAMGLAWRLMPSRCTDPFCPMRLCVSACALIEHSPLFAVRNLCGSMIDRGFRGPREHDEP